MRVPFAFRGDILQICRRPFSTAASSRRRLVSHSKSQSLPRLRRLVRHVSKCYKNNSPLHQTDKGACRMPSDDIYENFAPPMDVARVAPTRVGSDAFNSFPSLTLKFSSDISLPKPAPFQPIAGYLLPLTISRLPMSAFCKPLSANHFMQTTFCFLNCKLFRLQLPAVAKFLASSLPVTSF